MTRRTFLAAIAGLPLGGKLLAKAGITAPSGTAVYEPMIYFVGSINQWWMVAMDDPMMRGKNVRRFDTIGEAMGSGGPWTRIIVAPGHQEELRELRRRSIQ